MTGNESRLATVTQDMPAPAARAAGRLRVVIAEDSVLLLAGLTKLLDSAGFDVVATAGDAGELLAALKDAPLDADTAELLQAENSG